LLPKNYFAEAREKKPTCGKSLKKRSYIDEKNIELKVECSVIIQNGLPLKSKDPGSLISNNLKIGIKDPYQV